MEERKIAFEFVGVQIYESDFSKEAVSRLNEELVREFYNADRKIARTEIVKAGILTTKNLNEMLFEQLKTGNEKERYNVIEAILSNPNLEQIEEKIWKALSENYDSSVRRSAAESRFATEERLQKMLKDELDKESELGVIEAILLNPNLEQIEEEIWGSLSNYYDYEWETREFLAKSRLATEKRLQKMLEEELDKIANSYEIEAILSNPNLEQIDEEIWKGLSENCDFGIREIAAESRLATEKRLQEMLKHELESEGKLNWERLDVIKAILLNPNLEQIDEEIWKSLSENYEWKIREIAAKSRLATEGRLQEMLEHESKVGKDSDVIKAIFSNKNLKND